MRVFIAVVVLIFSLQSLSKADDIRDFEIEGMSIGDSLLDYMQKSQIKDIVFVYKDESFGTLFFDKPKTYDDIQITLKSDDPNYIIHGIAAILHYENNYQECLKKKDEITESFKSVISHRTKTQSEDNIPRSKFFDPSGKSIWSYYAFHFASGAAAQVFCTNWSDEIENKKKWSDSLKASLYSIEFSKYLEEQ